MYVQCISLGNRDEIHSEQWEQRGLQCKYTWNNMVACFEDKTCDLPLNNFHHTVLQMTPLLLHPGKYTPLWPSTRDWRWSCFPNHWRDRNHISATGQTLARATGRYKYIFLFVFLCLLAPVGASLTWLMVDYEFRWLTSPPRSVTDPSHRSVRHLIPAPPPTSSSSSGLPAWLLESPQLRSRHCICCVFSTRCTDILSSEAVKLTTRVEGVGSGCLYGGGSALKKTVVQESQNSEAPHLQYTHAFCQECRRFTLFWFKLLKALGYRNYYKLLLFSHPLNLAA